MQPAVCICLDRNEAVEMKKAIDALMEAAKSERPVSLDTICADIEALHSVEEDGLTVDDKARITSLLFQLV